MTHPHLRMGRSLAIATSALVLVAGPTEASDITTTAETTEPANGAEGCGPEAYSDQADRSADREVARCAPGSPEPEPLDEPYTFRLASPVRGEFIAPVLVGMELGEFEKENLTVEIMPMPFADAIVQMGSRQLDGVNGGPYAAFTNAAGSGINIRWVLGNYTPPNGGQPDVAQSSLWVRRDFFSDPENPDLSELSDATIANTAGMGSTFVLWMGEALREHGVVLTDLTFESIPPGDHFQALEQGGVDGAYMLDPYWQAAAAEPDTYVQVGAPYFEPNGGIFFGPTILEENPEAGEAFTRAYIRTINTYLTDGYHENEEVVNALAESIPVDPEVIRGNHELLFDWELREGLMDDLQTWFIELEVQTGEHLPESELVDRSFYRNAVGAG